MENPPGAVLCANCKYILKASPPAGAATRRTYPGTKMRSRKSGTIARLENSRRGALLVLAVVGVVILAAIFVLVKLGSDDPYMGATVYYRYVPPTGDSDGCVHVWGSVRNWGDTDGVGLLKIFISDDASHSCTYRIDVGLVPASGSTSFDEMLTWPYLCSSTYDLDAKYDVTCKSDWWF